MVKVEFYNGSNYEIIQYDNDLDAIIEMEKRFQEADSKLRRTIPSIRKVQDGEYTYLIGNHKAVYFSMRVIEHEL